MCRTKRAESRLKAAGNHFSDTLLARLYPFLEWQNADGISLLFSIAKFLNVPFLTDIQKV